MKKLFVVRHAKSSWESEEVEDYFRPLKPSGVLDALKVCGFLKRDKVFMPDIILTSPAIRAYSTALIFSKALKIPESKFMLNDGIYESSKQELYAVVKSLDDRFDKVMLFGHDSSLTDFVNSLSLDNLDKIPTSAVVGILLNIDKWNDLEENSGKITHFVSPKQFYSKD